MSGMKDLFGDTPYEPYRGEPPAVKHSETSQKAASSIKARIGPLHQQVIDFLIAHPVGATDEEMQAAIPMPANTERPRRRELELMGRVRDSGRTKLTKSKREAVVWILSGRTSGV